MVTPMGDPLISVIVPTHNRQELLNEALSSILRQRSNDWECVVVDDGSDPPAEVPQDPRIRIIRQDVARGPSRARNDGIRAARGKFICFLDDDDTFPPDRLDHVLPGGGAGISVHWSSEFRRPSAVTQFRVEELRYDTILNKTTPNLGTVTIRRDLAVDFDESLPAAEDLDWLLRVTAATPITVVDQVGWYWRKHNGPRGLVGAAARLEGSRLLMKKHAEYFASHRQARAFRLYRMGLLAHELGDSTATRRYLVASIKCLPPPGLLARNVKALARSRPVKPVGAAASSPD